MRDYRVKRALQHRRSPDHTGHFVALLLVLAVLGVAFLAGAIASTHEQQVVLPSAMRMVGPTRVPTGVPTRVATSEPFSVVDIVLTRAE